MSRRPLLHPVGRLAKAQNRMAPGGLLWSESPIPRRHSPRVPMVGDDTPAVCVGYEWVRTSMGDTFAEFTGSFGFVSLIVAVDYDCVATGPVDLWVQSVTLTSGTPGTGAAPTAPWTITGPDLGGNHWFHNVAGSGVVTGVRVEWDTPGALTACCVTAYNAE